MKQPFPPEEATHLMAFRRLRLSIRAKIIVLVMSLMLVDVASVSLYTFKGQSKAIVETQQERLMAAVQTCGGMINGTEHRKLAEAYREKMKSLPPAQGGWYMLKWLNEARKLPHYQDIEVILQAVAASHHLESVCSLALSPDGSQFTPVVRAALYPEFNPVYPIRQEMWRAFYNAEVVASGVYKQRGRTMISAYAPVIANRQVIGLVAADLNLDVGDPNGTGYQAVREELGNLRRNIALGTILGLILTGYIGYYLARRLTAPIQRLVAAAQKVSEGDMSVRVPVAAGFLDYDELADFSLVFNRMVADLEKSQQSRLEALIRSMTDGAILSDTSGRLVVLNPAARRMLGLDPDIRPADIPSQALEVIGLPDLWREALEYPDRIARREIRVSPEVNRLAPAESAKDSLFPQLTVLASCTAARESVSGAVVGIVTTLFDVTRERELQQMKEDFLASVSHELRSPLTAIAGFTEVLLEDDTVPERHQEFIQIIDQNSRRLLRLINDLLDMTKLEAGMMRMEKRPVDLAEMVHKTAATLGPLAAQKQIRILTYLPASLPPADVDPDRIEQVLVNLVNNAIKFTPENGQVAVGAEVKDGKAAVWVADTGVGIPTRDIERIFDKYQQVENRWTYGIKGTGLGLPIARQIVEAHGGGIRAESEEGKGSKFTFTVPLVQDDLSRTPAA
ncbi:MAG: HAMP domain-containing protein [Armatimonadetes bacterium]|nr:HAMP domain-containing protein [Armatimonadota bacterium]